MAVGIRGTISFLRDPVSLSRMRRESLCPYPRLALVSLRLSSSSLLSTRTFLFSFFFFFSRLVERPALFAPDKQRAKGTQGVAVDPVSLIAGDFSLRRRARNHRPPLEETSSPSTCSSFYPGFTSSFEHESGGTREESSYGSTITRSSNIEFTEMFRNASYCSF